MLYIVMTETRDDTSKTVTDLRICVQFFVAEVKKTGLLQVLSMLSKPRLSLYHYIAYNSL